MEMTYRRSDLHQQLLYAQVCVWGGNWSLVRGKILQKIFAGVQLENYILNLTWEVFAPIGVPKECRF